MTSALRIALASVGTLLASSAFADPTLPAAGAYTVQKDGSSVAFDVTELAVNNVKGQFHEFSGKVTVGDSPASTHVEAEVQIGSVDTNIKKRDEHLRGAEWFDADKFPKMTFKSTSIAGTPGNLTMKGDLTIKGVTKEVSFWTRVMADGVIDADTRINRKDFGITAGGVVKDEVHLHLRIRLAKQ